MAGPTRPNVSPIRPGMPLAPQAPMPPQETLEVSMDQNEFAQGGLPDDFDGEVKECWTEVWNYDNGNGPLVTKETDQNGMEVERPVFTLAVGARIKRDDKPGDDDDIITHWSAGDPTLFAPSMDGVNPSPPDETGCSYGVKFIRVGAQKALKNNTNWAQVLGALADAETQAPQLARQRTADVRFMVGLYAHWNRIPQVKRSGMAGQVTPEGGERRNRQNRDVLVPTVVKLRGAPQLQQTAGRPVPPARPVGAPPVPVQRQAPVAPSAPTPAAPGFVPAAAPTPVAAITQAASALDGQLVPVIQTYLANLGVDASGMAITVPKGKLVQAVLNPQNGLDQPSRAKGVPRVGNNDFLTWGMASSFWIFDADAGTVQAWPTE